MIDIPNPPSCYALKIICYGTCYDPDLGPTVASYTVYDPDYTSIWNMEDGKFTSDESFYVDVYVKWYSYSAWSLKGRMYTTTSGVTNTIYYDYVYDLNFLSLMEFNWESIPNP